MSVTRSELENYIGQLLGIDRFRDYSPNGLQVEGRGTIGTIVSGVTASQALIDAAITRQADALLVHHGYFWKSEDPCITRTKKIRLAKLLQADINLFAYHLPLDAHPELGNNARLGHLLGITATGRFGEQELGWIGELETPMALTDFANHIRMTLGRTPLVIGAANKRIKRIAWCSGGAQSFFHEAATLDVDCYLTGEASEFVTHLALESGVSFIAAGHHATERCGIKALGEHLAQTFGIEHVHIDLPNPV